VLEPVPRRTLSTTALRYPLLAGYAALLYELDAKEIEETLGEALMANDEVLALAALAALYAKKSCKDKSCAVTRMKSVLSGVAHPAVILDYLLDA